MRVLIFSTAYLPFVGGAEVAVKELTDRLGGDIKFDLITARLKHDFLPIEQVGAVEVHRVGFGAPIIDKLLIPFLGAIEAIRLNRERKYDCFWCIMVTFASGAAYIANWFQKKVPIVLTLQEGDSEDWLRHRWLGLIGLSWQLALRYASGVTAISFYLMERAKRLGYKKEIKIIPNGVDLNKFSHLAVKPPSGKITLVTTSRLVEKNGVGDIIESLKFLPENVRLEVIGTGPLESKLKSQSRILNLESRIKFVGEVSNSDIPLFLDKADVFVRPSLSEGQGISFIEAMAAGLPVIGTPVGGIPDFLKHEETGLFCEVNNPQSIAKVVERLITDEPLRKRIIENALKMVREKYDWNLIAKRMKTLVFGKV